MQKLYRLREWLTLAEAAEHMKQLVNEPVGVADIYRLALDGHLTLSVNLVNHARAQIGRVVPFREVPHHEALLPTSHAPPGQVVWVPDGMSLGEVGELTDETPFLIFDEEVVTIDGIWDLTMKGAEGLDIEHAFQQLTGGPQVSLHVLAGPLLTRPSGEWAQLQEKLPDVDVADSNGEHRRVAGRYCPASRLPDNAPLVVRMAALRALHARLLSSSETTATEAPGLGTRERDTLLKILIGMAIGGYGYEPSAARSPIAREISDELASHGMSVSDDTIREYLKEAAAKVLPRSASKGTSSRGGPKGGGS